MRKKSIIILALMVVLSVLLNYFSFFGVDIAGVKYDSLFGDNLFSTQDAQAPAEDSEENTQEQTPAEGEATPAEGEEAPAEDAEVQKPAEKADTGRIRKGIDLAGGSVISFEADATTFPEGKSSATEEDMDIVEAIFNTRLNAAGYTEARISRGELGQITVEIPSVFETDEAASLLGSAAVLSFVNASGEVVLNGEDIKDAKYIFGQTSQTGAAEPYVELTLTSEAVEKFAAATRAAASAGEGNNFIAIMMDQSIVSAPRVSQEINSETCIISGDFTPESARNLANQIKSGALPFSMKIISQDTIGAELGQDALPTSLIAAGIGILLVMLFMIIFYRLPGLVADLALSLYIGIMALILGLFRVNLSLSGIAGIVLSIGMAVDANVIIFERMKEELKLGKTIKASVESGFKKAFSAILDSNITTIITCVVLYLSGIGTIRGFAVTLGIGVVVSMFTAIVITKFLLKQVVGLNIRKRSLFYREPKANKKPISFDIVKNKAKFLILPLVVIVVGAGMFIARGGFNYDIEFMGGIKMQIAWEKPASTEEVRTMLEEKTQVKPIVVQTTNTGISIKTKAVEESKKDEIFNALKEQYQLQDDALLSVSSASANFGDQVQQKALLYTIIAVLCILLYIAFRFEWRSAVMSVIALVINILVMMAVYAITYTPLNTTFIAAMLTIIGYSINNTIVVFDRVRENMKRFNSKKGQKVDDVVNTSINESLGRTINTTITTLITIILLYFLGVSSVKEFAFPLIIGVIAGAYSSIFTASPFWASWKQAELDSKKKR